MPSIRRSSTLVDVWLALVAGLAVSMAWAAVMMLWRAYARRALSTVG